MRTSPVGRKRTWRLTALAVTSVATITAGSLPGVAVAAPVEAAAVTGDYCGGQCHDILPPGQNGNASLVEILAHRAFGTRPTHSADQLDKYANLIYNYAGLTDAQIATFYNSAAYGVPAGQVERTERPRSDVTILRDRATGIPHITGTTRAGTMYGAGFAGAEDRLFVMDLMRHIGRGKLTSFAGGAPGNQVLEQSLWRSAPYNEVDLQAQVERLKNEGTEGAQLFDDATNYVAGINQYIAGCMAARPVTCPGEYVLTGHLDAISNAGGPEPFTLTDLIAIGAVIGGLFGGGGGAEMQSALVRLAARAKYGTVEGDRVWQAFRSQNDPETVLTLHDGQSFPYGAAPADQSGVVMPDSGTVAFEPVVFDKTGSAATSTAATSTTATNTTASGVLPGLTIGTAHQGMSNAVVISAGKSATGHPVAVYGPQTGYYSPQLLMIQELNGPGISSRGIAFAGLSMYVLIGRGPDYSWSATSSIQDVTDTYAVPLCEMNGSTPTVNSQAYLWRGQCTPMDVLAHVNAWTPTIADGTAAGSYRLQALRTKYGLVQWRAKVNGQPVAFTALRSTYHHEADSALGLQRFNDPSSMGTATAFMKSASEIRYAFNWFYVNSTESAMYTSGLEPVRSDRADPNLPTRADPAYEWQGWNPDTNSANYRPADQHPHVINQDYLVSWNNKQAKDYSAADGNFSFGAVQRGDALDVRVKAALAGGGKLDRAATVRIVEDAATVDLRAENLLPNLLRVLAARSSADPAVTDAVAKLTAWQKAGAKRVETTPGSKVYQHADAIRIFDAWYPLLVAGEFKAPLGADLYQSLVNALQINESPSGGQHGDVGAYPTSSNEAQPHKGSAFQYGWWGYVDKDIRAVLGDPVAGPLPHVYCGNGNLAACAQVLSSTLAQAAAQTPAQVYPADAICTTAGNQWCADAIVQNPVGGITDAPIAWQNRSTYQQVVSFPSGRAQ